MIIYTLAISAFMLSLLGFSFSSSRSYEKALQNQTALTQIAGANVRTEASCQANFKLLGSSGKFSLSEASSAEGQKVQIVMPQFSASEIQPNATLESESSVLPLDLKIESLVLKNTRLLNELNGFKTFHGMIGLQVSENSLFKIKLDSKPLSFVTLVVDGNNNLISCQEDNSPQALCSRFGGVYNSSGSPQCSFPPPEISCQSGQILTGVDNQGNSICQSIVQSCPQGKYMTGFTKTGNIECVELPKKSNPPTETGQNPNDNQSPPTTDQENKKPQKSEGVWAQRNHNMTKLPCPGLHNSMGSLIDGEGLEGRACYAIGFQCREQILFDEVIGYRTPEAVYESFHPSFGVLVVDKKLECVKGIPSKGSARPVPNSNLRIAAKGVGQTSEPEKYPHCGNQFACSYEGEICRSDNFIPGPPPKPDGTAQLYVCEKFVPNFGRISVSGTIPFNPPTTCDPISLDFTDPRWVEHTSYSLSVFYPENTLGWCQYEAAKATSGASAHCNMHEVNQACELKKPIHCFSYSMSKPNQLTVMSCK